MQSLQKTWNDSSERCELSAYHSQVLTQMPRDDHFNVISVNYVISPIRKEREGQNCTVYCEQCLTLTLQVGCVWEIPSISFPPVKKEPCPRAYISASGAQSTRDHILNICTISTMLASHLDSSHGWILFCGESMEEYHLLFPPSLTLTSSLTWRDPLFPTPM